MPYHDKVNGTRLFKDDVCDHCDHLANCNVFTNLNLEEEASQYHEVHIVRPGEGADRENYLECQGFAPYTPPNERPDPDPGFGIRLSVQEIDMMAEARGNRLV